MLDIMKKRTVEEIVAQVTLRLVNGIPDDGITAAVLPFLMEEVEKEVAEQEAPVEPNEEEAAERSY